VLSIFLGIPVIYATGASLVSTIATSSGAASAYLKDRLTNMRIGMSLEVSTATGAIFGALAAVVMYADKLAYIIYILFGLSLFSSAYAMYSRSKSRGSSARKPDWTTKTFGLSGSYYDIAKKKEVKYFGVKWGYAEGVMFLSGIMGGLLGIGGGAFNVLGLDMVMGLPVKVATSTSNFMIGVTAASGSSIYWSLGYIQPFLIGAITLGVLIGAFFGTKVLVRITDKRTVWLFIAILALLGSEMVLRGIGVA
jgi:hypothetical protein